MAESYEPPRPESKPTSASAQELPAVPFTYESTPAPSLDSAGTPTPAPTAAAEADRPKPLIARWLNRIGIPTSPGVEHLLDWVQVLAVAGLLAWLTMTFVVVRMRVPTGSMIPTILEGDSFFVDKITYLLGLKRPQRGDVVVFWHFEQDKNQWVRYVKRLIALSGETVQVKDCTAYVNGVPLTDDTFNHPGAPNPERQCYYSSGNMGDQVWTVSAGQFFVLGDNSRNSLDSRWWGFVDGKYFIGEPFLRVLPPGRFGLMNGYFGSAR